MCTARDAVLDNKPRTWEYGIYDSKRFLLFDLDRGDEEYNEVIEPFRECSLQDKVSSLKRVQNPYQFGRFQLRKQQRQFRNEGVKVVKRYHCIQSNDLNVALEHNLDVRRYLSTSNSSDSSKKNPLFYKTPSSAFNSFSGNDKFPLIPKYSKAVSGMHILETTRACTSTVISTPRISNNMKKIQILSGFLIPYPTPTGYY